uniref:Uncharacterized protein n=1 Tax=Aegilops tauschii subsp. strangulata TaxID=200361 RepID=A0A453G758_AEGTS
MPLINTQVKKPRQSEYSQFTSSSEEVFVLLTNPLFSVQMICSIDICPAVLKEILHNKSI